MVHLLAPSSTPSASAAVTAAPVRAGFVVSRQVGNSVIRHRVTRQLRPLVARRLGLLPAGTDLVVRALPAAAGATSADLDRDLATAVRVAARRAGLTVEVTT